jgi:phenylacetyl-CoA:acceptor oxidoreductase subunit 2
MKSIELELADRVAPRQQRQWDWRAAANFVAGGAGGGLLICAAAVSFSATDVRSLVLFALALIAAGLTCVWFEIGRPWRALNVYRHFRTSWMTREATVAPLLFTCGALALLTGRGSLILFTGLLGAAFLYSQARMLAADKGIPAWRHPLCLPVVVATGLAEGAGFLTAASPLLLPNSFAGVATALIALLALRAVLWKRYLFGLKADGAPERCLRSLEAIDLRLVILGHVLPAVLAAAAALGVPGAGTWMIAAGLLSVAGGWMLKYTLVTRAAFTQGFALKHLPVRGCGAAGPAVKPGWDAIG